MVQASAEKLGPVEKERMTLAPQSKQVRQSSLCENKKSQLSTSPDREMRKSQGERKPLVGKKKIGQSESMERSVSSTLKVGSKK